MFKEITRKDFTVILKKQAGMVKCPWSFFKLWVDRKPMPKDWYLQYSWTYKQEKEFSKWLESYFIKKMGWNKFMAKREVPYWILQWGWKTI